MKRRRLKKTLDINPVTGKEFGVAKRRAVRVLREPDSSKSPSVVSASRQSAGKIDFDDVGNARWKWLAEDVGTETVAEAFVYMKALENDGISFGEQLSSPEPKTGGGYNPYDVGSDKKKR